jgi:hypothetical protein
MASPATYARPVRRGMARERKGAKGSGGDRRIAAPIGRLRSRSTAARRHASSWAMNEADSSARRPRSICQRASMSKLVGKPTHRHLFRARRCAGVTRNVPAAVNPCAWVNSRCCAFNRNGIFKEISNRSNYSRGRRWLAQDRCLWRTLQERVARIEKKWYAVLGQKGT